MHPLVVAGENFRDQRFSTLLVILACLRVTGIILVGKEVRLRSGNAIEDEVDNIDLGIQVHLLDDIANQRLAVVCVIDSEAAGEAYFLGFGPEDAEKNGVERTHLHGLGTPVTNEFLDTLGHFAGGLVGEGEGQNTPRHNPLLQHVGNAVGQHAGLARTGTGNHHYRTGNLLHGSTLRIVQLGQYVISVHYNTMI